MAEPRSVFPYPSIVEHADEVSMAFNRERYRNGMGVRTHLADAYSIIRDWREQYVAANRPTEMYGALLNGLGEMYDTIGCYERAVAGSEWVVDNPDGTVSAAGHKPNCLHCWCLLSGSKRECCECGEVAS